MTDNLIHSELRQMYAEQIATVSPDIRASLSESAFDKFTSLNWASVAERLEMAMKKSVFVPMIDVETGTSDASIVEKRRRLLLVMNDENER